MRLATLVLMAAVASAPAFACDMFEFREVRASKHVHVFEAAEGTTAVVNGNIVAVVGDDAVLLIDTGQIPSVARKVLARLPALSSRPVRHIVNTHWHGDHVLANFVFKERFPEAKVFAHPHTIAEAAKFYADDYAAKNAPRMATIAAGMKKRLAEARGEDEREWLGKTLACVERMGPEVAATRYVAPEHAIDGEIAIDLGGVTAVIKHIGAGNTPGDLIAWVPEDKVVATGDMVVAPVPYAIGSPLDAWSKTIGELLALGAATYVPGHGPVMHDDTYVRDVRELIGSTRVQLEALHAQGVDKAQAEARLDTSRFARKYITTAMRRQAFSQFYVKAAIARMWPASAPAAPAR